ncbi:MAG: hypothetical protein V4650_06875 [Pseudomonadota bacterium]
MKSLPCWLLCAAAIVGPAWSAAAEPESCKALQAEVETLRARLLALEAVSPAVPVVAPLPVPAAAPGLAAKPAAIQRVVVEAAYSRTGCSAGLFKGIAPARWQDADLWLDLEKGLSAVEVERLLGVEHYDEQGGGNMVWHYGKCGSDSRAQVLFTNGKLADWRAPSR